MEKIKQPDVWIQRPTGFYERLLLKGKGGLTFQDRLYFDQIKDEEADCHASGEDGCEHCLIDNKNHD